MTVSKMHNSWPIYDPINAKSIPLESTFHFVEQLAEQ